MSRVGKMPIAVPQGVDVAITADNITVKGSNGTLVRALNPLVRIKNEGGKLSFAPANDSTSADAMSGTMRALVANMVGGVSKGFEKKLALVGVGFRAQAAGQKLNLQIGYSHPVVKDMPAGIKVATPTQTEIVISGPDRQVVGQLAAGPLQFGSLEIDRDARTVQVAGVLCELTSHQFDLLVVLAERAGRVLTRDQIMEAVRGRELEAFDRSIDVHMGRIRAAIEVDPKNPKRIVTVRGVGYVFSRQQD